MKTSKLATTLREELLLTYKKMPPKKRINAFFTHSQLLMLLFKAGKEYRKRNTSRKILLNSNRKKIK